MDDTAEEPIKKQSLLGMGSWKHACKLSRVNLGLLAGKQVYKQASVQEI